MNTPRILQTVLSLNPGGTEKLVMEIARRLHGEMPTMVCCLDDAGSWAPVLGECGIGVHALHRGPGFRPSLGRRIAALAREHRASVVHAHHYSPFVYSGLARIWAGGPPVVFTEHGRLSDTGPSTKRRLVNRALQHVPARVFGVSNDVRLHLATEGFPLESVGVIYNGIDAGSAPDANTRAEVRRVLGVREDVLVIGTIARLDPVKDLGTLLRGIARVSENISVTLMIVGDGPERGRLESETTALGLSAIVRFLGHRDDARHWLAGCDLYANSSISEGVSLTILEAMAAALPVVATRVGGTPEVVDDSCGRLVPARDAESLAAAVGELAGQPALRQSLGRAGRSRVETRFTLDRMVNDYAAVYREVSAA